MNGRTVEHIARATDLSCEGALRLLEEFREAGLVEEAGSGLWRLTPHAERTFAWALAYLAPDEEAI